MRGTLENTHPLAEVLTAGRQSGTAMTLDDARGPLMEALQACFANGVPEQHRLQAWFEITGAAKVRPRYFPYLLLARSSLREDPVQDP